MKKVLLGLFLFMSLIAYGKEEVKYDHYRKMDGTLCTGAGDVFYENQ